MPIVKVPCPECGKKYRPGIAIGIHKSWHTRRARQAVTAFTGNVARLTKRPKPVSIAVADVGITDLGKQIREEFDACSSPAEHCNFLSAMYSALGGWQGT